MAITDAQIDEAMEKLRIAFGKPTKEALISELANRFLNWKLPKGFSPDAGISFNPSKPYEGDEFGNSWWPTGTNLFDHAQAKDMVRHMLSKKESK